MATLRVTQVRSTIGTKPKQRGTMRALGGSLERLSGTDVRAQDAEYARLKAETAKVPPSDPRVAMLRI